MRGHLHDPIRHFVTATLVTGLLVATFSGTAPAKDDGPSELPPCAAGDGPPGRGAVVAAPWRVVLDADGAVTEHRMTLRRRGADITLRTGRRGFAVAAGDDRVLIGEREDAGTRLVLVDTRRACQVWSRRLDRLTYAARLSADGSKLRMSAHEPETRLFEGTLVLDVEQGATEALIDGECAEDCVPNDGEVTAAAFEPAGVARPVPNFAAGGWPKDKTLGFRWATGAVPPPWARDPLEAAAADVARTSRARSPRFVYRSNARNSVRYSATFPSFCGYGIACAARNMPLYWGVWIRPHGTDFAWGTLRWCQRWDRRGCFDIRRVMLHELGHIAGLHHPSIAGSRLGAQETVMHAITPNTPSAGSRRHSFGRCDVATLQELYDVPDNRTNISTCNDVASTLSLSADRTSLQLGGSVKLTAQLRIAAHSAYRQLAGNPLNSRSVRLKYRRAGSSDAWRTAWMQAVNRSGRHVLTISPSATWEFKAVFPAPDDEGLRTSRSQLVKVKVKR